MAALHPQVRHDGVLIDTVPAPAFIVCPASPEKEGYLEALSPYFG